MKKMLTLALVFVMATMICSNAIGERHITITEWKYSELYSEDYLKENYLDGEKSYRQVIQDDSVTYIHIIDHPCKDYGAMIQGTFQSTIHWCEETAYTVGTAVTTTANDVVSTVKGWFGV